MISDARVICGDVTRGAISEGSDILPVKLCSNRMFKIKPSSLVVRIPTRNISYICHISYIIPISMHI